MLTVFPIQISWFGIEDICKNFIYVLLGMIVSGKSADNKAVCKLYLGIISFGMSVLLFYINISFDISNLNSTILEKIISVLMIYFSFTLAVAISRFHDVEFTKILEYVGNHAFTIYIYSWPIQAVVEMVVVVLLKQKWYVAFPLMFFAGLSGPIIIYEGYIRFIKKNKFLDRMIGVK